MKINDLYKILPSAIKENMNILLKGAPGVGKSDVIEDIVTNVVGYDIMICHPIVESPVDAKGLPVSGMVNGQLTADFIPYGNLRRMMEAEKPLVVFIDDLGQAAVSVQAAYMQIILAREINGKSISKHVRFIAATNDKNQNAGVSGLITPLLSRFAGVFNIEVDADSWLNWAFSNNMPAELLAYIKLKPNMLSTFDCKNKGVDNFACPRTIANLGKWINMGVIDTEVWIGCVGEQFAIDFKAFYDIQLNIVKYIKDAMNNPATADIPDDAGQLYFVMSSLAYKSKSEDVFNKVMIYIDRLAKEYQAFFVKNVISKNEKLQETSAYIKWHVANKDFVI